jgi:hypothetical protein
VPVLALFARAGGFVAARTAGILTEAASSDVVYTSGDHLSHAIPERDLRRSVIHAYRISFLQQIEPIATP